MEQTAGSSDVFVIRPPGRWKAIDVRSLWAFRELLWVLALRDIKLRYRQTALGIIWVVLQPLLGAAIFAFVFGRVAKLSSEGVPYFLFAYASFLGWNVFQSTLTKASGSLTQNTHLISKIYFPRLLLPMSTVGSSLVDLAVGLAFFVLMLPLYGLHLGMSILLIPVWLLVGQLLAVGMGLFLSALTVRYRDVQYALPVFMQMLMYASPVAYAVSAVPERFRPFYYLNPLAGILDAWRSALLPIPTARWDMVLLASVVSVVVFVAGAYSFKSMERQFADVI